MKVPNLKFQANALPTTSAMLARLDAWDIGVRVVLIQHLRADTVEFVSALLGHGIRVEAILAIPYSKDQLQIKRARDLGIPVIEPEMSTLRTSFMALCDQLDSEQSTYIVQDVGGWAADAFVAGWDPVGLIGIVEETKQGLWRYEKANLPIRVIQIADSKLKRLEGVYVGRAVAFAVHELVRSLQLSPASMRALIVGYGDIGRPCAHALRSLSIDVRVRDSAPLAELSAVADGFQLDSADWSGDFDLVIGCTGSDIGEDLNLHRRPKGSPTLLFSGSSRHIEFESLKIKSHPSFYPFGGRFSDVSVSKTYPDGYWLINSGAPINFVSESLPYSIIDLVFAQVVAGLDLLRTASEEVSGMRGLSDDALTSIATEWLRIYQSPGGDVSAFGAGTPAA